MKAKDFREKKDKELMKLLNDTRSKLHELSFKAASKQLKGVRDIRIAKRDIARILTILKERSL